MLYTLQESWTKVERMHCESAHIQRVSHATEWQVLKGGKKEKKLLIHMIQEIGFDLPAQGHFFWQEGSQDFFAAVLSKRKVALETRMIGYNFLFSIKIYNETFQVRVIVQVGIMICCAFALMNCSVVNNYIKYVAWVMLVIKRMLMSTNRWSVTSL